MPKTYCEFRIPEEHAHLLFGPNEGKRLGDDILGYDTRQVFVSIEDPRFKEIGRLNAEFERKHGKGFFGYWELRHEYTKAELAAAELFHLEITAVFEPHGWDCGTKYDSSDVCPECGVGVKQASDLILDLRKAPKTRDIAMTIVRDEWIVSQRLAGLMVDAGLRGFDLGPVRHKGWYEDDYMDFRAVPSGREILRRAEQAGCPIDTLEFWSWLDRRELTELRERMHQEWVAMRTERERRRGKPPPVWYQLIVTSPRVSTVPPTRFGKNPFDDDPEGEYRCSRIDWDKYVEHIAGASLLSELFIDRDSYDGSDIACTREYVGWPTRIVKLAGGEGHSGGEPFLLISPRFRKLLVDNKIRGWKTDVAYLR